MAQVQMPDGAVVEMPDTLTPELAMRLKALNGAGASQPSATPQPELSPVQKALQFWKNQGKAAVELGKNLYEGFKQPGYAAEQAIVHGANAVGIKSLPGIGTLDQFQQDQQARQAAWDAQAAKTWGGKAVQGVGQMAAIAPGLALAPTTLAATPVVAAAASLANPQQENGQNYAAQVGKTALQGAVVGMVPPVVGKAIAPVVGGIKRVVSGAPLPAEAQAVQDLGDKFGVGTLAPDLVKSPGMTKVGTLAESVPGSGMIAQRKAQQEEARAAAQKLLGQYGIEGDTSQVIQSSLSNKLAQGKASAKSAYDEVAKLASDKGTVPLDETLATIQKFKAQEASAVVPDQGLVGLLDKMETRIKSAQAGNPVSITRQRGDATDYIINSANGKPIGGGGVIETPESIQARAFRITEDSNKGAGDGVRAYKFWADKALREGKPFLSDEVVTPDAANIYKALEKRGYTVEKNPAAYFEDGSWMAPGKWVFRVTDGPAKVDLSYNGVRGLRSDIGSMVSDYYKGTNVATGSKGVQVLQGVKGAIENDLGAFTKANGPELAKAASQADSIYKNQVVPYKDSLIAKAVKSSEPDQIYGTMIQMGKGDRAQKFYAALDPQGQAAVRSQMVQNAMDNATKQDGVFSPAQFAASLEKVKDASGVFFRGQDKWELDGFSNLMRHVQRAGQINENPTNGQRLVTTLIAGEGLGAAGSALMGHPAALAAPVASMGAARALTAMFSTPAGKRFLIGASDLKPGSKALENLIETQLPKVLSTITSRATNVTPLQTGIPFPIKVAQMQEPNE